MNFAVPRFVTQLRARVSFETKLPEPEAFVAKPKPMTGFLSLLTADQRAKALSYVSDDTHGEPLDVRA